jgi:methylmalonyl-CoA mutase N-terminal domain/subunit
MKTTTVKKEFAEKVDAWEQGPLKKVLENAPERAPRFTTVSGYPIRRLYTPADIKDFNYDEKLGFPGEYPYTRGIHPTLYRGKLWTMRQFSGFGSAADTNRRYKYLLSLGQTGLSVAFQLPTLMGYDSDHPMSRGEVGKCGVIIDSLEDMEILFDGIPLDKVTTSMTINSPAAVVWAMYIAAAEKQGAKMSQLGGTIQNDILKEYIAQKEYIFPIPPSMRLVVDTFEFGSRHVPKWNTISISGYHIREAGSTAIQELAFTLADGEAYVQSALERGLQIDDFAPRLSFFFNAHNDLFEEVAKYRAARRIWAKLMRDKYKARQERSWWLRFHTQTAGCSLTAQQPYNNVVRVAVQALAALLGGTQSLHTNSLDESLALPSEHAVTIALRTQQILAHESGVANTIDPLAGSYFIENLTDEMERGCWDYFEKIESLGGMLLAVEKGFPQREIANAAYWYQKAIESKEKIVVGVNDFILEENRSIEILLIEEKLEAEQNNRLQELRRRRHNRAVSNTLKSLKTAAEGDANLMPYILEAVKAYATLGEIMEVLRQVFGEYEEPKEF